MKNKILTLINDGFNVNEITEKVYQDSCIAEELGEKFPNNCNEYTDCYDCWKDKITKIANGKLMNDLKIVPKMEYCKIGEE